MPSVPGKVKYVCDKTWTQCQPSVCSNCSVVIYNTEKHPFEAHAEFRSPLDPAFKSQAWVCFQLLKGNSRKIDLGQFSHLFMFFFYFLRQEAVQKTCTAWINQFKHTTFSEPQCPKQPEIVQLLSQLFTWPSWGFFSPAYIKGEH